MQAAVEEWAGTQSPSGLAESSHGANRDFDSPRDFFGSGFGLSPAKAGMSG
jgi:hypothetical protein